MDVVNLYGMCDFQGSHVGYTSGAYVSFDEAEKRMMWLFGRGWWCNGWCKCECESWCGDLFSKARSFA
jgi:hypothetical protein